MEYRKTDTFRMEKRKNRSVKSCVSYIVRHTMHRTVSVSIKQPLRLKSLTFFALSIPVLFSQTKIPEWCRALPRPEYKVLHRVPICDPWFEVYRVALSVFAFS